MNGKAILNISILGGYLGKFGIRYLKLQRKRAKVIYTMQSCQITVPYDADSLSLPS